MKRFTCAVFLVASAIAAVVPNAHAPVLSGVSQKASNVENPVQRIAELLHIAPAPTVSAKIPAAKVKRRSLSQLPIVGERITSVFGYRIHPIFKRRILHDGVDFSARMGQQVLCVLDGVVEAAGPCGGYGNVVVIRHQTANRSSMYAHLSRVSVRPGQKVRQGHVVGAAGSTGFSTGTHLHFGVKSADGRWQDPLVFLRKVPQYELLAQQQEAKSTSIRLASAQDHVAQRVLAMAPLKKQNSAAAVFVKPAVTKPVITADSGPRRIELALSRSESNSVAKIKDSADGSASEAGSIAACMQSSRPEAPVALKLASKPEDRPYSSRLPLSLKLLINEIDRERLANPSEKCPVPLSTILLVREIQQEQQS